MPLADLRSQSTMRTGDALVDHLNSFELSPRFTAGIWFFRRQPRGFMRSTAQICRLKPGWILRHP